MLLRMYTRWAEKHGFKVEFMEETPGRRGRHQVGDHPGQGPQRLWLAQDRDGRAPAGAHLAVRFQCAPPYFVRQHRDLSGDRRQHQGRHQGVGRAHRYDARERRRRPARQQDRVRDPPDPYPDRHRGVLPERPLAAPQPRAGLGHAARAALRARAEEARGGGRRRECRQDRHRLGPPDPLVRAAALSDGEGPAHRRADLRYRRRARRRSRSVHGSNARPEGVRYRARRRSRTWSRRSPR